MKKDIVEHIFAANAATVTGKLGACFLDLKTGESAAWNGDDAFQTCSVFKVFLLAELFRQVKEGWYALSDRHALQTEDKSYGSGLLRLFDDGADLTIRDYALLMMKISDNTATDYLFHKVGRDNIRRNVIEALSLTKTKVDLDCKNLLAVCFKRGVGAPPDPVRPNLRNTEPYVNALELNDETSPRDITKLLTTVYRGEWQGEEMDRQMLEIMKLCDGSTRLTKYLPPKTPVAHKTGSCDRVANDAGIIYTPKGDYVLALFYNGNVASEEEYRANLDRHISEEVLARISREVYYAYMDD